MYLTALQQIFGENATFREDQDTAINRLLQQKRVLVVQKTGWGKSLVYFLTTKIMRERGKGITLIISPLLSLTRNQIDSTKQYGIVADCINSETNKMQAEKRDVINRCNDGECDVLFITPEQIRKEEFVQLVSQLKVGLFVVDEAHCISDWGHDFRPDYRRIHQLLQILPKNISVLATTATANNRVITDVAEQLGDCEIIRGDLHRESLSLHKIYLKTAEERYAWIKKNIKKMTGSGIIYATTVRECERLASWLQKNGINAHAYHAERKEERIRLEQQLMNNEIKVLVSTISLGMGYDKEDISFVFHYYTPKSVIEYYQQVGRAGRAIDKALCVLLYGGKDEDKINQFFIQNSFPKQQDIEEVLHLLDQNDEMKKGEILNQVNVKSKTLESILILLSVEGMIKIDKHSYSRTLKPYHSQEAYYQSIIELKQNDYQELIDYQQTTMCQMTFLTEALDSPTSYKCGKCSTCLGELWELTNDVLTREEINEVISFFNTEDHIITPRKRSVLTNRNLGYVFEKGIALAYYYEKLGREASHGKYIDGRFSDTLVKASFHKLKDFFNEKAMNMTDVIIIPIPSNRRPDLVPDFAQRLASELQCKYKHILAKKPNEPAQKEFNNSALQEKNVRDYLYVTKNPDLSGKHILLVDDFVDSKWTFAIAAEQLGMANDHITVIPFALADTSGSN